MLKKTLLTTSIVFGGLLSTVNAAQWHMPTPYGDANLPTKLAYQFAEEVKEKTDGDLNITVHSGASLVKHTEIPRAVKTGQVQMGEIFIGIMGNTHPVFKHDNIPFLATNFDDAEKLWQAAKPEMEKQLKKEGMKLLYTVAWPAQGLYTKKAINSLSDIQGSRMRAYSPSTSRLADLMDTTPTTIQVPEIPQAFSTGIIDAMITSPTTGVNGQAWDYLTHYNDIQAWIPKNMVVVNMRSFKRLDKATQQVILDAAANVEKQGWAQVRINAKQDTASLAANGIKVSSPSAELSSEFNAIGKTMTQEWIDESGPAIKTLLENYQD